MSAICNQSTTLFQAISNEHEAVVIWVPNNGGNAAYLPRAISPEDAVTVLLATGGVICFAYSEHPRFEEVLVSLPEFLKEHRGLIYLAQ